MTSAATKSSAYGKPLVDKHAFGKSPAGKPSSGSHPLPSASYQPFSLTFAEISDPHIVLKEIFGTIGLNESRKLLQEWFLKALSPAYDTCQTLELIEEYHRMQRLVEAAWLLFMGSANENANKRE